MVVLSGGQKKSGRNNEVTVRWGSTVLIQSTINFKSGTMGERLTERGAL